MKKVWETLNSIFLIGLLLSMGFFAGSSYEVRKQPTIVLQPQADLLRLTGEIERYVVTLDELEAVLQEIRELATFSGRYKAVKTADGWRCLDDLNLPLTRNTVAVSCEGIVKAGYDVDLITCEIDEASETVYIRLPHASVLDNYVIMDTVDVSGSVNNILHPLSFEEYLKVIVSVEEEGLAQVTEQGLFERAEEGFRNLVTQCLMGVTDYRIVFL